MFAWGEKNASRRTVSIARGRSARSEEPPAAPGLIYGISMC